MKPEKILPPLADRIRPKTIDEFVGQEHILGEGKPLRMMIETGDVQSMILWGPPGVGKTTLAKIISEKINADFYQVNAVLSGTKEIKEIIDKAEKNLKFYGKKTILFIDEIHRFNKAQQSVLLNSVENGTIILIGATTENPSFEIISPLLSRCQVFVLEPLGVNELNKILERALKVDEVLSKLKIKIEDKNLLFLYSGGDARVMLNALEVAIKLAKPDENNEIFLTREIILEAFQRKHFKYDKAGEEHYNLISAFIKSIRGSDPDAAVYWLARMLIAGEDPKFIARRMIILASEDIGNAEPYALTLATSCFTAVDYVGMPEARIILAQVATYLASCPKSNSAYLAIEEAMEDAQRYPDLPVPLHLRNAPTKLMKELGYGKDYKYSHDFPNHFVEQQFLPEELKDKIYYRPTELGREKILKERLESLWKKRKQK
ncbi:replication-associated recombination protein A [Candidatus Chrysopegis kryptomonas]|uniref:Replication-associated recombination protein A n=1 Tax=Candidatus Chryseopegocella kryptomonas TaxID=1633643 RepID=A0A0P1N098_9BACT|nr:replication-associated recombination protein A [Candidatus Chrysopegis kryptomonas]CUT01890.1 putative ATPase [Candidatus Chrysopegis kryptomonas]